MTIPAGALTAPTNIRVVANPGMYVAYDMYPHGLRFRQPVTVVQGLSTTASYGTAQVKSVRMAYLAAGKERVGARGFVSAAELPAATTFFYGAQPVAETHEWILNHFSRYILVSGAVEEVEDDNNGDDDSANSIGGGTLPGGVPESPIDSVETSPVDSVETSPIDSVEASPIDSVEASPIDSVGTR